jgi:signal transduction histidine kinase
LGFAQPAKHIKEFIIFCYDMENLRDLSIPILILLGTFGMTILVGGILFFIVIYQKRILKDKERQNQQELEFQRLMIKKEFESQEQERKRIAADLHDSLGSLLWGAKVNASLIQKSIQADLAESAFNELNQILDEGVEVVRRIAWELSPESFQYSGFSVSVAKLCQRFNGNGLQIKITENESKLWNDNRALQTYRMIQELVSNAFKHSEATVLEISIYWSENEIKINVRDNGKGLQQTECRNGLGLWNLDQRLRQIDGKIRMGVPPNGKGLEVDLSIPM